MIKFKDMYPVLCEEFENEKKKQAKISGAGIRTPDFQ